MDHVWIVYVWGDFYSVHRTEAGARRLVTLLRMRGVEAEAVSRKLGE